MPAQNRGLLVSFAPFVVAITSMNQPALNVAIQAARRAGDLIHRYRRQLDRVATNSKALNDYVTEVDRACEAEIVREIRRVHPDHAILAEESGASGDSEIRWVIDPLDGTSNFMRDVPHYAISIAQQVEGRTEHAVVYDPIREELFTASRGRGALLNNQRLRVSARTGLDGAILATAPPFRLRAHLDCYFRMLQEMIQPAEDIRRAGAASLDLAYVAAGRVDGFWEIGLKPWDIAAGALLVREAGGVVVDFDGNDQIESTGNVIAAPFKLINPMQRIVQRHWKNQRKSAGR